MSLLLTEPAARPSTSRPPRPAAPPRDPSRAERPRPDPHPAPAAPPPASLTPLTPAELNPLLTAYFRAESRLEDVAEVLGLPILDLLDLIERPDVQAAIERINRASEARALILARRAADLAVGTLIRLADAHDRPETARKAAGSILRHGKEPVRTRKRAASPPPPRGEGLEEGRDNPETLSRTSSHSALTALAQESSDRADHSFKVTADDVRAPPDSS